MYIILSKVSVSNVLSNKRGPSFLSELGSLSELSPEESQSRQHLTMATSIVSKKIWSAIHQSRSDISSEVLESFAASMQDSGQALVRDREDSDISAQTIQAAHMTFAYQQTVIAQAQELVTQLAGIEAEAIELTDDLKRIEELLKPSLEGSSITSPQLTQLQAQLVQLDRQKRSHEHERDRVNAFLAEYSMQVDEESLLMSVTAREVDATFMTAYAKAKRTLRSVRHSSVMSSNESTLPISLLNKLNEILSQSTITLLSYLSLQLSRLSDSNVELEVQLRKASQTPSAQQAPMTTIQTCIQLLPVRLLVQPFQTMSSSTRSSLLHTNFLKALTTGDHPLELTAPEPVRFTGDVLSYLFQYSKEESSFLRVLLTPESQDETDDIEDESDLELLLSREDLLTSLGHKRPSSDAEDVSLDPKKESLTRADILHSSVSLAMNGCCSVLKVGSCSDISGRRTQY